MLVELDEVIAYMRSEDRFDQIEVEDIIHCMEYHFKKKND